MFSDLAHRLVGQEMFHVLDKAGVIERSGDKVYHLDSECAKDDRLIIHINKISSNFN